MPIHIRQQHHYHLTPFDLYNSFRYNGFLLHYRVPLIDYFVCICKGFAQFVVASVYTWSTHNQYYQKNVSTLLFQFLFITFFFSPSLFSLNTSVECQFWIHNLYSLLFLFLSFLLSNRLVLLRTNWKRIFISCYDQYVAIAQLYSNFCRTNDVKWSSITKNFRLLWVYFLFTCFYCENYSL